MIFHAPTPIVRMINLPKAKQLVAGHITFRKPGDLTSRDVRAARQYVQEWWHHAARYNPKDNETLVGLPKPYIIPSYDPAASFDYDELYYWDSYFIAQGLLDAEHQELVMGILEDLLTLVKRYKVIPNASRTYLMGRSQPPFLTSFIFDIHDTFHPGEDWLKQAMKLAQQEYEIVWTGTKKPNDRQVYRGLSRYYDINMLHDLAEAESGWDMTPRFHRRALNYLPVDLNALLYKYETDFARAARLTHDQKAAVRWFSKAEQRAKVMNELMWDRVRGLYFDYDYTRNRRSNVASLATFFPMWAGMVTEAQAAQLVKALRLFEHSGGLATTDSLHIRDHMPDHMPTQWAYPNGWAPLHLIVVQALERYGYHAEARRIAMKWLRANLAWFTTHHEFLEKYNVVNPHKMPVQGVYPTQKGFGWTNAVFERFCREYIDGQA